MDEDLNRGAADRKPEMAQNAEESSSDLPMLFCPVCNEGLFPHRCKLLCPRCGYFMSCADYY